MVGIPIYIYYYRQRLVLRTRVLPAEYDEVLHGVSISFIFIAIIRRMTFMAVGRGQVSGTEWNISNGSYVCDMSFLFSIFVEVVSKRGLLHA